MSEAEPISLADDAPPSRSRRIAGLVLAPALLVAAQFLPALESKERGVAAVAMFTFTLWITEAVPIAFSALLIAPLLVLHGVTTPKEAFAPYADPLLFLFIGGFLLAEALHVHRVDSRIARTLAAAPWVGGQAWRVLVTLTVATTVLSMWMSNTATAAIVVPIALAHAANGDKRTASMTVLCVAYASTIGGLGTPVGTPPNLITIRLLQHENIHWSFSQWMTVGVPTSILLMLGLILLARRSLSQTELNRVVPVEERGQVEPWTRGQRVAVISFAVAITGWLVVGNARALGIPARFATMLPEGAIALLAAVPLFVIPRAPGRDAILTWKEAQRIDWGIVMLFGGGIALGDQMLATGLASRFGRMFILGTGVTSVWTLAAVCIVATTLLSEFCSNTAAVSMLGPLVLGVSRELHIDPTVPVLATGFAASLGFMLPVATGANAIAYGTGKVRLADMLRTGLALDLVGMLIVWGGLRLLMPLVR